MNAGAYDGEIKDIVETTTYIDEKLDLITINNKEHEFAYRDSVFLRKKGIIINTVLTLKKDKKERIKYKMEQNLKKRREKQPINLPNAGSIFKRGEEYITAKLIEEANLKGFAIGGAMVSTLHSGFIVNTGNATAQDVENLIKHIKETIRNKFNKSIELEIKIIGD